MSCEDRLEVLIHVIIDFHLCSLVRYLKFRESKQKKINIIFRMMARVHSDYYLLGGAVRVSSGSEITPLVSI